MSDRTIAQEIGKKIKTLRLRQNTTQKQLSEYTQLSLSTIKKIEKGDITSFSAFLRILRMLGKLDVLTPLVEEEPISPVEYSRLTQLARKHERKRASKQKTV